MSEAIPSIRILRLPAVKEKTGLSRSQIYRLMANNDFPSQVDLSDRVVGWIEGEIELWLRERKRRTRGEDFNAPK
ncbi:MAG: AlpA family transcriptional regulator [Rudaea sp.]|uniref:AlpA family transcriptional regulator n=1 Tax=Rudaea sp. TaxID=2136325 RepID=UPI0039E30AC8